MIESIMSAAGIPANQGRYINPPDSTYGVWFDDQDTSGGPDPTPGAPLLIQHSATVELYEPAPDPAAEARLEAVLLARNIHWTRQDRYWLQNVRRHQVIYEFEFNETRRA